ncbi:glycosyltransferase family 2 protein [Mesoaciditoga lauensis]|uniref:glycosyltransferase family 2 protein n=1 Tax=Mesoaciditoga lauensis TaxID=1495039 RepID=UPI000566E37C|nr:glycosyltransferase family 2 protein [Mesoaciditoga lauensis]
MKNIRNLWKSGTKTGDTTKIHCTNESDRMRVLASVVTFNPDIETLIRNLSSIYGQADSVLLVDNGSTNYDEILDVVNKDFEETKVIRNIENIGIAAALNKALDYASERNFGWLLTLDQDSIAEDELMKKYKNFIDNKMSHHKIAIIAPKIVDPDIKKMNKEEKDKEVIQPLSVITSGSLINVDIAKKVGGFLNKLFIDSVDHEFCLRIKKNEYEIYKLNYCKLHHKVGNPTPHNFLGLKIYTSNHAAVRNYYIFRNDLYLSKRYLFSFPKFILRKDISLIKRLVKILLYEKEKKAKIKYSFQGIIDFIIGRYGKYEEHHKILND